MKQRLLRDPQRCALDALLTRPESLSHLMPYDHVLEGERIFVNRDGSLGVVFDIELAEHEVMTESHMVEVVGSIKSWFSLPENAVLQVIFEQSELASGDNRWQQWQEAFSAPHKVSDFLFRHRLATIREGRSLGIRPMERRAMLTIRWFPAGGSKSMADGAKPCDSDSDATLRAEASRASTDVMKFLQLVRSFESASNINLTRLGVQDLLDRLRQFFNPKSYYKRRFANHNQSQALSDQVIFSSPGLGFNGIEREGVRTRTLTLKTSPSFAYPGGMAYFTTLGFPLRIAMNVSFPSKAKVKRFFDLKEMFLENTPSARARRQKEEVLEVQDRLVRDDRCLHMSFHITIEGETDEELEARTRDVLSIFHNRLDCEAIVENDIGGALALNSLPLFYSPQSDLSARRYIRVLRSDAVMFVPVFDSFRGLSSPLQLYLSREGNPVKFSLFENETSNHTVVLADSGSGKSSFVIDCVQAVKRQSPEPLVFVIDKKSSYLMLSQYFDANLTVFGPGEDMPFSPFRGVFDSEKVAFLTQLIGAGIKLTSPTFTMESEQYGAISKAIRLAHQRKHHAAGLALVGDELVRENSDADVTLTMDDVVAEMAALGSLEEFEKSSDMIDSLVQKLAPFYGDGIYARYFNAHGNREQDRSRLFYIYDLDALDGDPVLQSLMTMAVVEEIRQIIKQHRDSGRTGLLVLEELQMLGRGNSVGKQFVLDAAETFRKLGVWLVSLTPRPQTYFDTEVGQAMWGVADNFVFLQMSSDNVDYVAKNSSLLDQAGVDIVKSLRTVRGSHADVFYTNKKRTRSGAFRFFQTPYDRWLAPTNVQSALAARQALARYPDDKWKALEDLAARFPTGL